MIKIRGLKIRVEKNQDEELTQKILKRMHISSSELLHYRISKRSIDARDKNSIFYVYEVYVQVLDENRVKSYFDRDMFLEDDLRYQFPTCNTSLPVVIVGSGPAGLFCAYYLAKAGCKPIILERGEDISHRVKSVEEFWKSGNLNLNSNIQFGEGGAGTFSDGKLNTLVKDREKRMQAVLEVFVECGAPKEILYDYKPHIGTDILRKVIVNMREKIEGYGGVFRFQAQVTDFFIQEGEIRGIEINHQEKMDCSYLVLAIGHSARDTFEVLYQRGLEMSAKPFAIGLRVEHVQELINRVQYGEYHKFLGAASYKLTYKAKSGRGVYSFCMCPGGYVVNASSEASGLVINGMSNYDRESANANSAIIVTVSPDDFGTHPLAGMYFQRELEEKTYQHGNGKIPTQRFEDFLSNRKSTSYGTIKPLHKGFTTLANLNEVLPDFVLRDMKEAMEYFGRCIQGFDDKDVLLSAIETRTSSPIRIQRDPVTLMSNIKNIFPAGEGSGYAGGITTSAIDGIHVAEVIVTLK